MQIIRAIIWNEIGITACKRALLCIFSLRFNQFFLRGINYILGVKIDSINRIAISIVILMNAPHKHTSAAVNPLTSKVLGSNGESEGRSILGFCSGFGAAGAEGRQG